MALYDPNHPTNHPADTSEEKKSPTGNHCPKCGSTNIRHDVECDIIGGISIILPGPVNIPGINYVCKKCGHRYTYVS